jgi:hypothetical protein
VTAEDEALTRVVRILESLDIPYMVAGSFASSVHGRQLSDVRGILDVQRGRLDLGYIERWGRELDIWDLWQEATR